MAPSQVRNKFAARDIREGQKILDSATSKSPGLPFKGWISEDLVGSASKTPFLEGRKKGDIFCRFCSDGVSPRRYICIRTGCMGPLPLKDSSSFSSSSNLISSSDSNKILLGYNENARLQDPHIPSKKTSFKRGKLLSSSERDKLFKWTTINNQVHSERSGVVEQLYEKPKARFNKKKPAKCTAKTATIVPECKWCYNKHENRSAKDDCKAFFRDRHHHWSPAHEKLQTKTKVPECHKEVPGSSDPEDRSVLSNSPIQKMVLTKSVKNVPSCAEKNQISNIGDLKARLALARLVPGLEGSAVPPTRLQLWIVEQKTAATLTSTTTTVVSRRSNLNLSNCGVAHPGLTIPTTLHQVPVMSQHKIISVATGSSSASKCTYTKGEKTFMIKSPGQSHDTVGRSTPRTIQPGLPISIVPPVATTIMSGRQMVRLSTPKDWGNRSSQVTPTIQVVTSALNVKPRTQSSNVNTTGNSNEQRNILPENQFNPMYNPSVPKRVYKVISLPSTISVSAQRPLVTLTTVSNGQSGLITVNSSRPVLTSSKVNTPEPVPSMEALEPGIGKSQPTTVYVLNQNAHSDSPNMVEAEVNHETEETIPNANMENDAKEGVIPDVEQEINHGAENAMDISDVAEEDAQDILLGKAFIDEEQVETTVKIYAAKKRAAFVRTSNNKKQMRYECKHGKFRPSESDGVRPNQHTVKMGCKAKINLSKRVSGEIVVTTLIEEHNHPVNEAIYHMDTDKVSVEEEEIMETLLEGNCKASQIRKVLKNKGVHLTTRQVRYKMKKILGDNLDGEKLNSLLAKVEEEGGNVKTLLHRDGTVRVLTVTTAKMKAAFCGSDPSVLQVDTTFNYETSGYKLSAFLYLNPTTNKGEVGQLSFMGDEGGVAYQFAFTTFRSICLRDPPVIIIDKDFTEIRILKIVFPLSVVILCIFHVIKWMKTIISTANVEQEEKVELMTGFKGLIYALDEERFLAASQRWYGLIADVEVRVGSGDKAHMDSLTNYYNRNWLNCTDMWTKHQRRHLPLCDEHTTNRLERAFKTMKLELSAGNIGSVSMERAVGQLVDWAEHKVEDGYTTAQRRIMQIFDEEPAMREVYREVAKVLNDTGCLQFKRSIEQMREHQEKMYVEGDDRLTEVYRDDGEETAKSYNTTDLSCNCTYWKNWSCPCRHILFSRQNRGLPLFEKRLFPAFCWIQRVDDLDAGREEENDVEVNNVFVDLPSDTGEENVVLNAQQKFNIIRPRMERLTNMICRFGMNQFAALVSDLDVIEKRVRSGQRMLPPIQESVRPVDVQTETNIGKKNETPEAGENADSGNKKTGLAFRFLKEIKSRGRPRGRAKLTNFNRSKRCQSARPPSTCEARQSTSLPRSFSQPRGKVRLRIEDPLEVFRTVAQNNKEKTKKKKVTINKEVVTIEDGEDSSGPILNVPDNILCVFPKNKIGSLTITTLDYVDLTPGSWVNDQLVNFYVKYLEENLSEEARRKVVCLDSGFYNCLVRESEKPVTERSYNELSGWTRKHRLWRRGSPNLVVLPVIRFGHWVTLVGVLGSEPLVVVLNSSLAPESLGEEPHEAILFRNFLISENKEEGGVDMSIVTPSVPQQPNGYDCSLFVLKFIEKILEDPDEFERKTTRLGQLQNLFEIDEVGDMRKKIADLIVRFAKEQGTRTDIPYIDFDQDDEAPQDKRGRKI